MADVELIVKETKSELAQSFKRFLTTGKQYADMVQQAREAGDSVAEGFAIACGLKELKDMILNDARIMEAIVFLRGSSVGFRTDCDHKDIKNQYGNELLATIAAEAGVKGLRLTGNEINIIQGQLYETQDGWLGKLERLPGVTMPTCQPGTIREEEFESRSYMTKGYKDSPPKEKTKIIATVSAVASCCVWGRLVEVRAIKTPEFDSRVQVTTIADFPDEVFDQIKGKVRARMWHDLFLKCEALAKCGPNGPSIQADFTPVAMLTESPSHAKQPTESTKPVDTPRSTEGQMNDATWNHDWRMEAKRIGHTEGDPHQAITMAREMREATTIPQLENILDRAKKACGADKKDISTRLVQKLEHYARFRTEKIMEPMT